MDVTTDAAAAPAVEDALTCAICLCVSIRPTTTSCGHTFCRRCLRAALTVPSGQRRCPTCRHQLHAPDGLAINFALWAIIQSLFPAHVAAAPDSPAAAAAAPFARPVLGRSRLGPGRHDARPFVPPRAAFAAAAPRQPPRLPSEVERIFDELEMEDAVAATPEPLVRRQRAPRLEDELAALAIGAAFQQAAGSPGGSAAVDVIDLTADEAEAPPPPRAAGGRGGDALRRAALRPTQQHHHGSGAPAAGGGPPQRKVVSGMFYSAAPSAAARAARGG